MNGLKDDEMLKRELDAVSYEITETYINDIAKEISSLKRSIGMDGIILTGTLLTSYATGGLSLLGSGCGNYFRNERFYKTIWRCTRKSRILFYGRLIRKIEENGNKKESVGKVCVGVNQE